MANVIFKGQTLPGMDRRNYKYKDFNPNMKLTNVNIHNSTKKDYEGNLDVAAVMAGLRNIFTWTKGERILLPTFGSNLQSLLYEPINDTLVQEVKQLLVLDIRKWEPRVVVKKLDITITPELTEQNTVYITIEFTIPSLSDKVYLFKETITG